MPAGPLRHSISIQQRTDDQADFVDDAEAWKELFPARASITKHKGREAVNADQQHGLSETIVRTRWQSGVTPGMRVKFGSRYLNIIEATNEDERNRWLVMRCIEAIAEPA